MQTEDPEEFETRPAYRRVGLYLPGLLIAGLALAVLVFLVTMQVLGWDHPILRVQSAAAPYAVPAHDRVYLYESPNTHKYFASIGGDYERLLQVWRGYLTPSDHLGFVEITEPASLDHIRGGVLILPSAVALSDAERGALARFRDQGGALLATWASGARDAGGAWKGWQFLQSLGARVTGEILHDPTTSRYLILSGEAPVSQQLAAGQGVLFANPAESLLRLNAESIAARVMNAQRNPGEEPIGQGAVVFSESGPTAGRAIVFSFAESAWEAQPHAMYRLIDDGLAWLQRQPVIVRAAWPNGKRAAQVVQVDVEDEPGNTALVMAALKASNFPASFYMAGTSAKLYPDLVRTMARDFEIGYLGEVANGFKDQTAQVQQQRIAAMRAEMATLLPGTLAGFHAPSDSADATTEKLLYRAGIQYAVVAAEPTGVCWPYTLKSDGDAAGDPLVLLPRCQRDDVALSRPNTDAEHIRKELIRDFELTLSMGALGVLAVHSQEFGAGQPLTNALPGFFAHAAQRSDQVWFATCAEVASWWRERGRLKLSYNPAGNRVEFFITVTGSAPLKGASLVIMLPHKDVQPVVRGQKVGMPPAHVQAIDHYRAAIVFDQLEPGNYAYQATFDQ